jgi:hypothetical protein
MIRFRDEINPAIELHNEVVTKKGKAYWGLWLKAFEDADAIWQRLTAKPVTDQAIYIADTASKANPKIYMVTIGVILRSDKIERELVPEYYRGKTTTCESGLSCDPWSSNCTRTNH